MQRHLGWLLLTFSYSLPVASSDQSVLQSLDEAPVVHYTIERRGGPFSATAWPTDCANFTYLTKQVDMIESRFNFTRREYQGNKLVRRSKATPPGEGGRDILSGNIATEGFWHADLQVGEPRQKVSTDLDLLSADFYVLITTSHLGSRYDDMFSSTFERSNSSPYPYCKFPSDVFHLPTLERSLPLGFAYCRPPKASSSTLGPSGSKLGLAPFDSVGQTHSTSLLSQLLERDVVQRPVFSIMLIDGNHGILSFGGTAAPAVEMVKAQTKAQLDHMGQMERGEIPEGTPPPQAKIFKRRGKGDGLDRTTVDWDTGFVWTHVQGAEGWWQLLIQGIWVDGVRVLRNQAAIIDLNSPLTLAPPLAASTLYASISSTSPLSIPRNGFYTFPCLNPPTIEFELAGRRFTLSSPTIQSIGKSGNGVPGGKLSLGRLEPGSGYCVGGIVETKMGVKDMAGPRHAQVRSGIDSREVRTNARSGPESVGANGLKDVWIIGESFFRGVGVIFDVKEKRVGFRAF